MNKQFNNNLLSIILMCALLRKLIDDRYELKTLILSDDSDFRIHSQTLRIRGLLDLKIKLLRA